VPCPSVFDELGQSRKPGSKATVELPRSSSGNAAAKFTTRLSYEMLNVEIEYRYTNVSAPRVTDITCVSNSQGHEDRLTENDLRWRQQAMDLHAASLWEQLSCSKRPEKETKIAETEDDSVGPSEDTNSGARIELPKHASEDTQTEFKRRMTRETPNVEIEYLGADVSAPEVTGFLPAAALVNHFSRTTEWLVKARKQAMTIQAKRIWQAVASEEASVPVCGEL